MKMSSRRNFLKSVSVLGIALPVLKTSEVFSLTKGENFTFQSPFMNAVMESDFPRLSSLWIDSLGKSKVAENPILVDNTKIKKYESTVIGNSISYRLKNQPKNSLPSWKFKYSKKDIQISSENHKDSEPFTIKINQELNHITVLGVMKEAKKVSLPCVIHLPDMGTFRVTSNNPEAELIVDGRRMSSEVKNDVEHSFVSISFPSATSKYPKTTYQLDIVAIHPKLNESKNDSLHEGFERNFLNIFQVNPRLRVLANNSTSDPCAFTLYMSAQLAQQTPPLANGLTAMDLVKMTLDRYISGMKAYGLVGFTDNYEGADTVSWKSKYDSLDSHPSLLMAACYYINSTKDTKWLAQNKQALIDWAEIIVKKDTDGDGLIEHPLSGNYGSWKDTQRPANWWDTIGFAHKDAFSNALTYRALKLFGEVLQGANISESEKYLSHATKIKSVYFSTFYNPETGVLAGWKSADGQLHDYYFTFVNSIAVNYDLLTTQQANQVMDKLLSKMKEVGFTNFSLGLPGNLLAIRKGDYTVPDHRWGGPAKEDGSDAFEIYENGGATACYTYFMVDALQKLNRHKEANVILHPILESVTKGDFSGKCSNGMSKDWKTWKGECWGYEGFLCDGYMVLLACLGEK
jgi:hypothetical protein